MKKKAKSKKLPVFKHIVKRKQKRKDKKTVYYYYSKTDKKITSKVNYNDSLKVRKIFKEKYGKGWLKKFYSGVTQIKQIEKAEKKHSLLEIEKIIKDYQKKTGYPKIGKDTETNYINFSGESAVTGKLISNITVFIQYNDRYYLVKQTDILELNGFFFYVVDTFMNALRKTYTNRTIKGRTKKGLSPFILWRFYEWINTKYPEIFVLDLNLSYSSEGFEKLVTFFKELIREGFNEFLFRLPVKNIYKYAYNSKK